MMTLWSAVGIGIVILLWVVCMNLIITNDNLKNEIFEHINGQKSFTHKSSKETHQED